MGESFFAATDESKFFFGLLRASLLRPSTPFSGDSSGTCFVSAARVRAWASGRGRGGAVAAGAPRHPAGGARRGGPVSGARGGRGLAGSTGRGSIREATDFRLDSRVVGLRVSSAGSGLHLLRLATDNSGAPGGRWASLASTRSTACARPAGAVTASHWRCDCDRSLCAPESRLWAVCREERPTGKCRSTCRSSALQR